jgi:two-component system response regulator
LDLKLPKVDGREVLKIMKSDESLKSIPVAILTSSAADRDLMRNFGLCPDCWVTKPVDLQRLIEIVKSVDQFWLEMLTLPQSSANT